MSSANIPSILIVDDDMDLCTILALKLKGLATLHAEGTLAGCLDYLKDKKPSLLLLDNNLPDGLGITFLQKFKYLFRDVKIVLITSDTSEQLREDSLSAGAIQFLPKPFNIQAITNAVRQALSLTNSH